MNNTKILGQTMTRSQQAGFKCAACGVTTIKYEGVVPVACLNCTSGALVKSWEHILVVVETTEALEGQ